MEEDQTNENEILQKLNTLLEKQINCEAEIHELRRELENVKRSIHNSPIIAVPKPTPIPENRFEPALKTVVAAMPIADNKPGAPSNENSSFEAKRQAYIASKEISSAKKTSDLEKFIGENLINKIGIQLLCADATNCGLCFNGFIYSHDSLCRLKIRPTGHCPYRHGRRLCCSVFIG
jgi:hypothetical protein